MATLSPGVVTQWLFGSVVVLLYAIDRFETPVPARGTTTFTRYWVARTGYVASLFLLYLLLAGAFTDAESILKMILNGTSPKTLGVDMTEIPGPLFAALMLTSLLPHVPYLKNVDELVKRWFQRLGNIPLEVRALSRQLQYTRVMISPQMAATLRDVLDELGIRKEWLTTRENTLKHKWARIAALYASVVQWNRHPAFMRYLAEHGTEFDDILKRVQAIRELDENTLAALSQDAGPMQPWRKRMVEELGSLQQALCDFIAGALLQEGRSRRQRQVLLSELGFEAAPKPIQRLTAHDIFLVGGIIFLMMLFTTLILNQNFTATDLASNISMRVMFMVPVIYCVAIVAAIYPKAFWPFADIQQVGYRPIMGYVVSGLLAMAAAFMIQLLFRYVQGGLAAMIAPGSFMKAFRTNLDRWPWMLMNFLMTIAIAWAADNHALSKEKVPSWLRMSETLGLAAICGALQWVTLQLLLAFSTNPARWDGKVGKMILTSTLVGGIIGFFVPHYYRARGNAEALPGGERAVPRFGTTKAPG
ncbi:hypothetical protein EGT07_22875 [Herbaspirillum sp. HC18]|nr:hypothetical protein EGT07_22875 [Herbaspirillum sp. HC18]